MIRLIALLLCLFSASCALKVMSFNLFADGRHIHDGLQKAAKHIHFVNPDVVALQESGDNKRYEQLMKFLGSEWSGVVHCKGGIGVITRHTILGKYEHVFEGVNVRIQLKDSGKEISVWSMHLQYRTFGAYRALEKGSTLEQLLEGEMHVDVKDRTYNGRVHNIVELLKHPEFVKQIHNSDLVPVFVAGDFNVPSHLDWTEETKNKHNGWVVEWPVTKLLTEAAGMTDSFREINPDPSAVPGSTWCVHDICEGKEREKYRMDFIFYRGSLRVKSSYTYYGTAKIINDEWRQNDWPSDHWAVITEFENMPVKNKGKPTFNVEYKYERGQIGSPEKCESSTIHSDRIINHPRVPSNVSQPESDLSTCVCTEIGKCLRCNGNECDQVSSCDATHEWETSVTNQMVTNFNEHKGACKCLGQEYCEHFMNNKYTRVRDCSEYKSFTFCNAVSSLFGWCWTYHDGYCSCSHGSCYRCYANGCKQTDSCKGQASIAPPTSNCKLCNQTDCTTVPCLPECVDESNDNAPLQQDCWCRDNDQGGESCFLCTGTQCKGVSSCDRFATCRCDMETNSYSRCYGYKHGQHICRTLDSCSNVAPRMNNGKRAAIGREADKY